MKAYKLTIPSVGTGQYCIFPENARDGLMAEIETSEIGDKLEIEVLEMTEEEYSKLPEFEGW